MEIKVGDKVRVSKDAQEIFVYGLNPLWFTEESTVIGTHPDGVLIKFDANNHLTTGLPIPTKYLIKVDAEAKFKVGDKVVVHYSTGDRIGRIQEVLYDGYYDVDYGGGCTGHLIIESRLVPYTEPTAPTIKVGDRVCCYNFLHLKGSKKEDYMGYVTSITDIGITIQLEKGGLVLVCHESDLELVQPNEQTEETSPNVNHSGIEIDTIVVRGYIPDLNSFFKCDWDAYTADLAKEIAVKITNKKMDNDPKEAADYAVSVAKAVVENLKKK